MSARILIVDDEASIRFALEEALTRDGHDVASVESGRAALIRMSAEPFDLVLLDLRLPDIEGTTVLAEMRARWPETIIIMLTAHATLESAVAALRVGAHDYLIKPCSTDSIRLSVNTGLAKREAAQRVAADSPAANDVETNRARRFFSRKGLTIDFDRHQVKYHDRLLDLTPTEFSLFAHLALEAPRVVSAQELIQEAQGITVDASEAREMIRFHVHRLRSKLRGLTGDDGLIQNVRGIGYAIDWANGTEPPPDASG